MLDPDDLVASSQYVAKLLAGDIDLIIENRVDDIHTLTNDGDPSTVVAVILIALAHVAAGACKTLDPDTPELRALMAEYALSCDRLAKKNGKSPGRRASKRG